MNRRRFLAFAAAGAGVAVFPPAGAAAAAATRRTSSVIQGCTIHGPLTLYSDTVSITNCRITTNAGTAIQVHKASAAERSEA